MDKNFFPRTFNTKPSVGLRLFSIVPRNRSKTKRYGYDSWRFEGRVLTIKTNLFMKQKTLYIRAITKANSKRDVPVFVTEETLEEIMRMIGVALFEYQKIVEKRILLVKSQNPTTLNF